MNQEKSILATAFGGRKATDDDNGSNINFDHDASIFNIHYVTDSAENSVVDYQVDKGQRSQKLPSFQEVFLSPTQYEGIYESTMYN